jgi:ribosomal protein S18 acetylase RimI-like enzyme
MFTLPVLAPSRRHPAPDDLVRLYHRLELHRSRALADETEIDGCAAFVNPELQHVPAANRLLDAVIPAGATAGEMVERVTAFYAGRGSVCHHWVPNPTVPASRTEPLRAYLQTRGYEHVSDDILYLSQALGERPEARADLQILPARAAFAHARRIAAEAAAERPAPGGAEAAMLHLDDPQYECLLAIDQGKPVGRAGLLTVGELGLVEQLFVLPQARRQHVASTLVSHLLALAARALLRHVLLRIDPAHTAAQGLFHPFGFQRIGAFDYHAHRPDA